MISSSLETLLSQYLQSAEEINLSTARLPASWEKWKKNSTIERFIEAASAGKQSRGL